MDSILATLAQIRTTNLFPSKIWHPQPLDIMASYNHAQCPKKIMIQSSEKLVTNGQTNRQMDESDFIGRCPTNVEHPIIFEKIIEAIIF